MVPSPLQTNAMAGVGKLIKEAQKMQKRIAALQEELDARVLEVTSGGAVKVRVNGSGKFLSLDIDPEFLKEEPAVVQEVLLGAFQEAADKAKALHEEEMRKATAGFSMPGMGAF